MCLASGSPDHMPPRGSNHIPHFLRPLDHEPIQKLTVAPWHPYSQSNFLGTLGMTTLCQSHKQLLPTPPAFFVTPCSPLPHRIQIMTHTATHDADYIAALVQHPLTICGVTPPYNATQPPDQCQKRKTNNTQKSKNNNNQANNAAGIVQKETLSAASGPYHIKVSCRRCHNLQFL